MPDLPFIKKVREKSRRQKHDKFASLQALTLQYCDDPNLMLARDELRQWISFLGGVPPAPARRRKIAFLDLKGLTVAEIEENLRRGIVFRGKLTEVQAPVVELESHGELLLRVYHGGKLPRCRFDKMVVKNNLKHFLQRSAQFLDLVQWKPCFDYTDADVNVWRRLRAFPWAKDEATTLPEATSCAGGPALAAQQLDLLCADREALGPEEPVRVRKEGEGELLWGGAFSALHPPPGTTHVCNVAAGALSFEGKDGELLPRGARRACGADDDDASEAGAVVAQWDMWDDPSMRPSDLVWVRQKEHLLEAAQWVHGMLGEGNCVLINCRAGQNRSGAVLLVWALRHGSEPCTADGALQWLQKLVPGALNNRALAACACEAAGADAKVVAAALAGEYEERAVVTTEVCSRLSPEVREALQRRAEQARAELALREDEHVEVGVEIDDAFASGSDCGDY